jgi:hypothetical protein
MTAPHSSIGQSFLNNGTSAIDATHAMERRFEEAEARRILSIARHHDSGTGLRHTLGAMIISLGTVIAGTTATIQDRQATMPDPSPKPGFVPTP